MGTLPNHLLFQRPPGVYVICCVMSLVVTSSVGVGSKLELPWYQTESERVRKKCQNERDSN